MYLLDTDWIIQTLGNRQPAARILALLAEHRIFVSFVSVAELYEPAFNSVNPEAHLLTFRHFLSAYRLLTLTHPIAERFAQLRSYLRRRGELIPDFDLLIAATALEHNLTLLTFNLKDFRRVPDLRIYQPV